MVKTTVRMVGYGKNEVFDAGSFIGLPTYITAPQSLKESIKDTYMSLIDDKNGSMAWVYRQATTRQLSEHVYMITQALRLSLYRLCSDNIGREDESTRKVFRIYTIHDYSRDN